VVLDLCAVASMAQRSYCNVAECRDTLSMLDSRLEFLKVLADAKPAPGPSQMQAALRRRGCLRVVSNIQTSHDTALLKCFFGGWRWITSGHVGEAHRRRVETLRQSLLKSRLREAHRCLLSEIVNCWSHATRMSCRATRDTQAAAWREAALKSRSRADSRWLAHRMFSDWQRLARAGALRSHVASQATSSVSCRSSSTVTEGRGSGTRPASASCSRGGVRLPVSGVLMEVVLATWRHFVALRPSNVGASRSTRKSDATEYSEADAEAGRPLACSALHRPGRISVEAVLNRPTVRIRSKNPQRSVSDQGVLGGALSARRRERSKSPGRGCLVRSEHSRDGGALGVCQGDHASSTGRAPGPNGAQQAGWRETVWRLREEELDLRLRHDVWAKHFAQLREGSFVGASSAV